MYNISADTLRYYEKIGLIDPVKRNENGIRDYKEIDLKRIQFLKCMRLSGLSIDMLLQYIELLHQGEHTIPQRKEIMDCLCDENIETYDDVLLEIEKTMS